MAKGIDQGTAIALIKGLGGSASASAAQAAQEAQAAQAAAEIAQSGAEAALAAIPEDYSEMAADLSSVKSHFNLNVEEIPDTVQAITFDAAGNVDTITHTRNNVAIRTDEFTFGADTITEVRTLNTGESLTIATNTDTLVTTVTYSAA